MKGTAGEEKGQNNYNRRWKYAREGGSSPETNKTCFAGRWWWCRVSGCRWW